MGLLDNSGTTITVDAVVTDFGRQLLARGDGSFNIARYSFADDEIDYSLFNPDTSTLQQDTNILNTPIFEAAVNEKLALKYQLVTISSPDLKYLPSLAASVASITAGERNDSQVGKAVEFKQTTQSGRVVPVEIVDGSFILQMDNDLLFIVGQSPASVTPFGTSQYVLPRTGVNSTQGAQVTFNVGIQSIPSNIWDALGVGTKGTRTITTKVRCQGTLSGLVAECSIVINEEFVR